MENNVRWENLSGSVCPVAFDVTFLSWNSQTLCFSEFLCFLISVNTRVSSHPTTIFLSALLCCVTLVRLFIFPFNRAEMKDTVSMQYISCVRGVHQHESRQGGPHVGVTQPTLSDRSDWVVLSGPAGPHLSKEPQQTWIVTDCCQHDVIDGFTRQTGLRC